MIDEHGSNNISPILNDNRRFLDQTNLQANYQKHVPDVIRKLDYRLMPFLSLLEFISFLNRISMAQVRLSGLQDDLKLGKEENDWDISVFYMAYFIFAIPSIWLLRIIGATPYLSLSMIAWGSITVGMAFVKNAAQLLAVRFLLGMVQAGYFPGITVYIAMCYRKQEQTMRMTIFFSAAILSGACSGILAYFISKLDGVAGLQGWQWIFLLEGLPVIPLGFITFFFLENISNTVHWLSNVEQDNLTNMLLDDAIVIDNKRLSWRQVRYTFVDRYIYLYTAIGFVHLTLIKCLTTYLPVIVEGMGFTKAEAQLLSAPPYVIAFICMLLGGYSSSRKKEHGYHTTFFLAVCILGFILMATVGEQNKTGMFIGICIACCGTFTAFPIVLSWLTKNVSGHTKRAMGVGLMLAIGQIGGVLAPQIYRDEDKPYFRRANIICACITFAALIITLILRFILNTENKRRACLSQDQFDKEAQIEEPCDRYPGIRYFL